MNRRHFINHCAAVSSIAASSSFFTQSILANANDLKKRNKSAILLWMSGGPSTIDLWDLKPGTATGGIFKPVSTSADGIQICEHLPLMAQQMHHMNIDL